MIGVRIFLLCPSVDVGVGVYRTVVYHLLPLAYKVLDNIVSLVDHEMTGVGGARMVALILTPSALWKRSGEAT